ncbi:MAG: hypothetical protein OSA95_02895 [Opitutales bacterium]|nr:hypothetical protein [Opitutales bacterium]
MKLYTLNKVTNVEVGNREAVSDLIRYGLRYNNHRDVKSIYGLCLEILKQTSYDLIVTLMNLVVRFTSLPQVESIRWPQQQIT